jgi:ABC-2 type transport system permease protein
VRVRPHLGRIAAITKRDLLNERSYQFRQGIRLFQIAITAGVVYYLARIVADPPELAKYRGTYFDFAMIGLMVMSIANLGIGTFNNNISTEQSLGTMEVLLATPTPLPVLLAGSFVFPLMLTALDIFLYFTVGLWWLGSGLSLFGVLWSVPLLALTLLTFCAFGVFGASVVVLAKRGDPFTGPLTQLTAVLSGALFPVTVFPPAIQLLARAFPAFYGINGLRDAILGSGGWRDVVPDLLVLVGFSLVLVPASLWCFNRAVATARRAGTLGNY